MNLIFKIITSYLAINLLTKHGIQNPGLHILRNAKNFQPPLIFRLIKFIYYLVKTAYSYRQKPFSIKNHFYRDPLYSMIFIGWLLVFYRM